MCKLIPKVTSYTPASVQDFSYANTPIKITFNMTMEYTETPANESLFNYNNINIIFGSDNITSCFETPVFDNSKTILTIVPKAQELCSFIAEEYGSNIIYFDVNIILGENITVQDGETALQLKQDEKAAFVVRYKLEIEKTPPTKEDFFLTRDTVTPFTDKSKVKKFALKNLEDLDEMEILQNRVKDYVYIYGKYYDAESGVKTVKVKEHHDYAQDGESLVDGSEEEWFDFIYTNDSENTEFYSDGTGYTIFCIKHKVQSGNGAVSMQVSIIDACDNMTETGEFYIIKRDSIESEYYPYNIPKSFYPDYQETRIFDMDCYEQNLKTIKVYNIGLDPDEYCGWGDTGYGLIEPVFENFVLYEGINGLTNVFTLYCDYKDKYGILRHEKMLYHNEEEKYWYWNLDVDSIENLEVKILVIDDIGASCEKIWKFPSSKIVIQSMEDNRWDNTTKYIYFADLDSGKSADPYKIWIGEDNQLYHDWDTGVYKKNYTYIAIPWDYTLFGQVDLTKTFTCDTPLESVPTVAITNYSFSENEEIGYLNITISINGQIWEDDEVDRVIVRTSYEGVKEFEKGQTSITFKYPTQRCFESAVQLYSYAIKDDAASIVTEYKIPRIADRETRTRFDEVIPEYWSTYPTDYDNYKIRFADFAAGLEHVYIKINGKEGKTYYINDVKVDDGSYYYWTIYYPKYEFIEGYNSIYVEAHDLNGNILKRLVSKDVNRDLVYFKSINKNVDSTWTFDMLYKNNYSPKGTRFQFYFSKLEDDEWVPLYEPAYNDYDLPDADSITGSSEKGYSFKISNKTVPDSVVTALDSLSDTFIRIVSYRTQYSDYNGPPEYYYLGEASAGNYDLMFKNGDSKTSLAIQSDRPVFVHTLTTNASYDECKSWSAEKWESTRKEIGKQILSFANDNIVTQRYNIPMRQIDDGEYYVVIAHFANGDTVMSEIMQK